MGKEKMSYELAGILLTVVIQALYIAYKIGKFEEKLENIEQKQDKHNNLVERMVRVEDSTKSAHKRIDDIKGVI
jgi:cell division protein FtsL